MSDERVYVFRDPLMLTGWLQALIWVIIGLCCIEVVLLVEQYTLLREALTGSFGDRSDLVLAATQNDARLKVNRWVITGTAIATTVLYFVWVYRTSANIHALGATGLNATPGFAVGVYFIPFFNLLMVPVIMSEIRKASIDVENWSGQRGSAIVGIWWTLLILSMIAAGIVTFLAREAHGIPALQRLTIALVASMVLDIVFRLSMLAMVRDIGGTNTRLRSRRALVSFASYMVHAPQGRRCSRPRRRVRPSDSRR